MTPTRASFFTTHKRTILALLFGLAFSATLAYAVPPSSQYTPGETLDPTCIPGSTNCSVNITPTVAWGSITGTLSSQTDLQTALNAKFDDPTGTTAQYIRGDGSLATLPTGGSGIALETNGVTNGSQSLLNLTEGSNINISDDGSGEITISTPTIDTIYTADGTISGSRTIELGGNDFNIRDTASGDKVGIYIDTAGLVSTFGSDPVNDNAYVQVDNTASTITLNSTGLVIPNGAIDEYVLTTDGVGNATWQIPVVSRINSTSLASRSMNSGLSSSGTNSLFLLNNAGANATNASNSIFIGASAGSGATDAANSIFLGTNAGLSNTTLNNTGDADNFSILIGNDTSTGGFSNSIAIGENATNTAANQLVIGSGTRSLNTIVVGGGQGTLSTANTIAIGANAGEDATNASNSIFIGNSAGQNASAATGSFFIGTSAGAGATNVSGAGFIGDAAGFEAVNASSSLFLGSGSGFQATDAARSTFIGVNSGNLAANSSRSVFIGYNAGIRDIGNNTGTENAPNSVFIGYQAGGTVNDITLDNTGVFNDITTFANTSITIGYRASTGGFSNSIAIGAYATNTASNEFMIGSSTRPINTLILTGAGGNTCTLDVTVASPSCTSDERLKTKINNLGSSTLDQLLNVRTVSYEWINFPEEGEQIGFIAQDLEQYFPQLVSTAPNGYLTVSYGGMTPILVEAIREMNAKIVDIGDLDQDNSWRVALTNWFASAGNGIAHFFAGEITTKTLCVADESGAKTCLTKGQLDSVLSGMGNTVIVVPPPADTYIPSQEGEQQTVPSDEEAAPETSVEEPSSGTSEDFAPQAPVSTPSDPEPAPEISTPTE